MSSAPPATSEYAAAPRPPSSEYGAAPKIADADASSVGNNYAPAPSLGAAGTRTSVYHAPPLGVSGDNGYGAPPSALN